MCAIVPVQRDAPNNRHATLYRLHEQDFEELPDYEGVSPGWSVRYEEMEPYSIPAERLYDV